ncbi:eukaryotic translation initiation factor 4E type 2-like [Neolamprologus brichardi]|uniref:eukaryotic translation initiation factor 4E type 2-like n=1 Tax=Neolamprologus brichardi TaxID=32507 RepID=UPI001643792E|nr:eukaryotic translation initiation factor 4E type 2-like [Neolamprologus brichardi]
MDQLERPQDDNAQETDCHVDNADGNNNNNNRRKTVCPGAGEHPLQYNYTFWYSRRTPSRPASSLSYEQNIRQIGTVASVEQFWRFYSHLVRPGDLSGHSDFHLFKEGIKPMWEGQLELQEHQDLCLRSPGSAEWPSDQSGTDVVLLCSLIGQTMATWTNKLTELD